MYDDRRRTRGIQVVLSHRSPHGVADENSLCPRKAVSSVPPGPHVHAQAAEGLATWLEAIASVAMARDSNNRRIAYLSAERNLIEPT